ncbi:MAG TPA: hypothetical protein VHA54_03040 [Solirubrobacterales bacterium]|nr:hypothetical protein [Solirubrobacterales bacterium]
MSCVTPETWISAARFAPFLNAAAGDHELAVTLYDWHAELAAASFEAIHHFEVIVRNAIDGALGEGQPQAPLKETWLLDFDLLQPGAIKRVIIAIERLGDKPATRGRVVAGVPFGFWASLFNRHHEELWRQHMHRAFSHAALERKELARSMSRILRFRNRVAHHDCLLLQNSEDLAAEMCRIVGWIDPRACAWFAARTRVVDVLAEKRLTASPQACSAAGARAAMPSL